MNVLTEYLSFLKEQSISDILYHGSYIQGLKYIEPKKSEDDIKYSKRVFGSESRMFGAIFAMPWRMIHLRNAVNCKSKDPKDMRNCDTWVIEITRRNMPWFRKPCSLYHIKANGWARPKVSQFMSIFSSNYRDVALPEYYTFGKAKVVKEEKYKSIKECYQKNGVKFKYKGVSPNYKPSGRDALMGI